MLRPYRDRDFDLLHALDQICYPPRIAYSKRMLGHYLALPDRICLVAENEAGRLAGFLIAASERSTGHIITLDVRPESRRQGLGSALYLAAENQLAERGVRSMVLESATDNASGIAFWQSHGYRIARVLRHYYWKGMDAYYMTKPLPARSRAICTPEH
jgi:[ribosomal protein S18]-alanine N-acetyltransferase